MKIIKNNRNKCYRFDINPTPEQEKDWSGIREIIIVGNDKKTGGINNITDGDFAILEPLIQNHLNSTINACTLCNMEIEEANYKGLLTLKAEKEKELVILEAKPSIFELG